METCPVRATILGLLVLLATVAAGSVGQPAREAEAGLLDYRLIGGPFGRYYTTNGVVYPAYYFPRMHAAVASWNATGTTSFTHTTNWSISAIDFYVHSWGPTGYSGVAIFFSYSGQQLGCTGCVPTANWSYAELRLNEWYLAADREWGLTQRTQSTAGHEFGHGIALSHSGTPNVLMYPYISRYDTYGIFVPQMEDAVLALWAYQ